MSLQLLQDKPVIESIRQVHLDDSLRQEILGANGDMKALGVVEELKDCVAVYKIIYRSQGHLVMGYVAEPLSQGPHPCIIVNRGGSKDFSMWTPERAYRVLGRYASWGYTVIASQYSGSPGSGGKDEWGGSDLEDVLSLKGLLDAYEGADSERIGMVGYSRGGMMTYRAVAEVDWIRAAVVRAGVTNLYRSHELRPKLNQWHAGMFDISSEEEMRKRSVVFWPEKLCKTTPLLIIHGTADASVSVLDSLELAPKLYEQQVPFRLQLFEGAGHFLSEFKQLESEMMCRWLDRFVKNGEALPNLELHD